MRIYIPGEIKIELTKRLALGLLMPDRPQQQGKAGLKQAAGKNEKSRN